jgi:hypothetical protein
MGMGAAMQALKSFSGGGGMGGTSGGQNQFLGMAMGQASKLFDQQVSTTYLGLPGSWEVANGYAV